MSGAGYDGSAVARTSLSELQLLHRRSFGHRNARTYLVVLVDPSVPACVAIEQQVGQGPVRASVRDAPEAPICVTLQQQ